MSMNFTKLGMCVDIVVICFGIADGQILSVYDSNLSATHLYFHFKMLTLVNINGFSQDLVCTLVNTGLGLLIGKFHQFMTELSTCTSNMIMAGYYHFTFLFSLAYGTSNLQDWVFPCTKVLDQPLHVHSVITIIPS